MSALQVLSFISDPSIQQTYPTKYLSWPQGQKEGNVITAADVILVPVELLEAAGFLDWLESTLTSFRSELILFAKDSVPVSNAILSRVSFLQPIVCLEQSLISSALIQALEHKQLRSQHQELLGLVESQNQNLEQKLGVLQQRLERRQSNVLQAKQKNHDAYLLWESSQQASFEVYSSHSIGEVEVRLQNVLSATFKLQGVRILFEPQDDLWIRQFQGSDIPMLQIPLHEGGKKFGSLFLLKTADGKRKHKFLSTEVEYFSRLAEVVGLAVLRIKKFEELVVMREQWSATFNAIKAPLSLVTETREVIQSNSAYGARPEKRPESQGVQKKCYQQMFQREDPCPGCKLGQAFTLEMGNQIWEVSSQPITETLGVSSKVFFHHYKDVTEQRRLQEKIRSLERDTELGVISASVAHELNNPLAGILSYVQLLMMEVPKDHEFHSDLLEMESAVKRSQVSIETILLKSRENLEIQGQKSSL